MIRPTRLLLCVLLLILGFYQVGCKESEKKMTNKRKSSDDNNTTEQLKDIPSDDQITENFSDPIEDPNLKTESIPPVGESFSAEEVKEQSEPLEETDYEKIVSDLKEHWEGKRMRFGLVDFPNGQKMCLQFSTQEDQCIFVRSLAGDPDRSVGACTIEYGDPWDFGSLELSFEQDDGLIITLVPNVLLKGKEDSFLYNDKRGIMETVEPDQCPI